MYIPPRSHCDWMSCPYRFRSYRAIKQSPRRIHRRYHHRHYQQNNTIHHNNSKSPSHPTKPTPRALDISHVAAHPFFLFSFPVSITKSSSDELPERTTGGYSRHRRSHVYLTLHDRREASVRRSGGNKQNCLSSLSTGRLADRRVDLT